MSPVVPSKVHIYILMENPLTQEHISLKMGNEKKPLLKLGLLTTRKTELKQLRLKQTGLATEYISIYRVPNNNTLPLACTPVSLCSYLT